MHLPAGLVSIPLIIWTMYFNLVRATLPGQKFAGFSRGYWFSRLSMCIWLQRGQRNYQTEEQRVWVSYKNRKDLASWDPQHFLERGWSHFHSRSDLLWQCGAFLWAVQADGSKTGLWPLLWWSWSCCGWVEDNASYSIAVQLDLHRDWKNALGGRDFGLQTVRLRSKSSWDCPNAGAAFNEDCYTCEKQLKGEVRVDLSDRGFDLKRLAEEAKQEIVAKFKSLGCRNAIGDNNAWVLHNCLGGFCTLHVFFGRLVGWNRCWTFRRNALAKKRLHRFGSCWCEASTWHHITFFVFWWL